MTDDEREEAERRETARRFRALGSDPAVVDYMAEHFEPEPEDETPAGTVEVVIVAPTKKPTP